MLFDMYSHLKEREHFWEFYLSQQQFIFCMFLGWFAKTDQA